MVLSDLVHVDSVSADLRSLTRESVLSEILDSLCAANRVQDKPGVLKALLDREKQGSTGIGNGVAVPHARIKDLSAEALFVGISKQGIDFYSPDGKPARVVILLLTPVSDIGMSLKILANIARLVNDRYFTNRLMQASTNKELYSILKQSGDDQEAPIHENTQGSRT